MSVGIVLLAAGEAKRFGSSKLILPIDGVALVRRAVLAALVIDANVVVVIGAHRDSVESQVADLPIARVFNANWAAGMGGSIACGIAALPATSDAAIIALADQALVGAPEFGVLVAEHERAPERIIAAQYSGIVGPPCLFPRQFFADLSQLSGEHGARRVLQRHAADIEVVSMPRAALDIDTADDYSALQGA
jgi:molybdenum cofactor cytidylyltransferase